MALWSFQKQNREEGWGGGGGGGTEQKQQTYQFTQGYNILHRLLEKVVATTHLRLALERGGEGGGRRGGGNSNLFHALYLNTYIHTYTRKMVPPTGRAHSLYFWSFQQKRIERRGDRTTDLSIYPRL